MDIYISNTASIINLAFPKSDNNNNNIYRFYIIIISLLNIILKLVT